MLRWRRGLRVEGDVGIGEEWRFHLEKSVNGSIGGCLTVIVKLVPFLDAGI